MVGFVNSIFTAALKLGGIVAILYFIVEGMP